MNAIIPRPGEAIYDGGSPPARDWLRFFREIINALGFSNDTPVFADMYIDAFTMGRNTAEPQVGAVSNFIGLFYTATILSNMWFVRRLGTDYKDGTDLVPYIEWCPTTTGTGNVLWRLGYALVPDATVVPVKDVQDKLVAASGTANRLIRTDLTTIDGSAFRRGDLLLGHISRVGNDATDTYADSAALFGVGFSRQRIGVGETVAQP